MGNEQNTPECSYFLANVGQTKDVSYLGNGITCNNYSCSSIGKSFFSAEFDAQIAFCMTKGAKNEVLEEQLKKDELEITNGFSKDELGGIAQPCKGIKPIDPESGEPYI